MIVQSFQLIGRFVHDLLFWIAPKFFWLLLSLGAVIVVREIIQGGLH